MVRHQKETALKMLHKIEKFFETNYKHLGYNMKINGSNLSHVLVFMKTYIITNIENNIKMHFAKYVNQFANSFFKQKFKILVEKTNKCKTRKSVYGTHIRLFLNLLLFMVLYK